MESHSLKALVVFKNYLYPELIRTVHVYKSGDGGVEKKVEREYVFYNDVPYEEMRAQRVLTLHRFCLSELFEGLVNGVWLCIFVFDADRNCPQNLANVPTMLSITKNLKLEFIPTLTNDLKIIFGIYGGVEGGEILEVSSEKGSNAGEFQSKRRCVLSLDLNSVPIPEQESEESDSPSGSVENKKKRAKSEDVARLSKEDLAKHFDCPILEASKNLKVGLTVLKRKCREFGIRRWPHRKIKSLGSLIRNLQEEVEQQKCEDEDAAMIMAKRQQMLENEKENIERKPFVEIQWETKKLRQDVYKKRHKARAREIYTHPQSIKSLVM